MIKQEEITYINNNPNLGIKVNWEALRKDYKSLVKAKNIYDPCKIPFEHIRYGVLMSTRKTGKTNTLLTLGLICAWKYGTMIAYVRQTEDMIEYRNIKTFFEVQLRNNYISEMTGGEYTGAEIKGDYGCFVHYDEKMKVDKRSAPVVIFLSISKQLDYKSTLNLPNCNLVLFDEFISTRYSYNEYVEFLQLLSTVIRDKTEVIIMMLANSTNVYSPYFYELCIAKEVKNLKPGNSAMIRTKKGTSLYIELIDGITPEREQLNMLYFGFDNPKLKAITGGDWAVADYPHIQKDDTREVITKGIYLTFKDIIIQMELLRSDKLGLHVLVHRANKIDEKCLTIYTISDITDSKEQYAFGRGKLSKLIWKLYDDHKFYYADNEVGDILETYVKQAMKL